MRYFLFFIRIIIIVLLPIAAYTQQQVNIAEVEEPLFEDNTTDIGAKKGDIEISIFPSWYRTKTFVEFNQGIEIEYSPLEGFGIELGVMHEDTKFNPEVSHGHHGLIELGVQFSSLEEKYGLAGGLEIELLFSEKKAISLVPFVRYARIWSPNLSSQFGLSPSIQINDNLWGIAYQTSLLYTLGEGLVGVELIGDYSAESYLIVAPQMGWAWGNFSISMGLNIPLINRVPGEMNLLLCFTYEFNKND